MADTVTESKPCPNCERIVFRTTFTELYFIAAFFVIGCVLVGLAIDRRITEVLAA